MGLWVRKDRFYGPWQGDFRGWQNQSQGAKVYSKPENPGDCKAVTRLDLTMVTMDYRVAAVGMGRRRGVRKEEEVGEEEKLE